MPIFEFQLLPRLTIKDVAVSARRVALSMVPSHRFTPSSTRMYPVWNALETGIFRLVNNQTRTTMPSPEVNTKTISVGSKVL